jgi:hypothetical protein
MKPENQRIHLIARGYRNFLSQMGQDRKKWESGFWALSVDTAKKLIGGSILFHEKKSTPSYARGIILGYRIQEAGEWKGMVIFKFEFLDNHRQVWTDGKGWKQDMKIVLKG